MDEKLYRELDQLTKDKTIWKQNIPYVASLLKNQSPKITAKAMWLLGEMGLIYPREIAPYTNAIASFIVSDNDLLRERSANALGRIGRADYKLVAPYFGELFILAKDKSPNVRLSFIWASENIATNTPTVYKDCLPIFAELLNDKNDRVRIEAPEMFRVLGKRKPEFVRPYLERLEYIATHDEVSIVRIHTKGAIRATLSKTNKEPVAKTQSQSNFALQREHKQYVLKPKSVTLFDTD